MKHNILFQKKLRDAKSSELLSELGGRSHHFTQAASLSHREEIFLSHAVEEKKKNRILMFSLFLSWISALFYFSLFLFVRVSNAAFAQCRMLSCCSEHPFFRLVFLANGWNLSSVAAGRCALRFTSHTREKVGSFLVSSVNKMCFDTEGKGTGLQMSSNISVAFYCCHLTYCCFPHASPHRRAHLSSSWSSALESFLQQPMSKLLGRCLSHLRVAIKWKAQSLVFAPQFTFHSTVIYGFLLDMA